MVQEEKDVFVLEHVVTNVLPLKVQAVREGIATLEEQTVHNIDGFQVNTKPVYGNKGRHAVIFIVEAKTACKETVAVRVENVAA